jgi:hypothetical protein
MAAVKDLLFRLQVTRKFTKLDLNAVTVRDRIIVSVPAFRQCSIRVRHCMWTARFLSFDHSSGDRSVSVSSQTFCMRSAWHLSVFVSTLHQFRQAAADLAAAASVRVVRNGFDEVEYRVAHSPLILRYCGLWDVVPIESGEVKWWRLSSPYLVTFIVRFPPVPPLIPPVDRCYFATCVAASLAEVLRVFDDPDFAVIDPTDRHQFAIVYRRKFTFLLHVRPLATVTLTSLLGYPSRCLFSCLWGIAKVRPTLPLRNRTPVLTWLSRLPDARKRIVQTAEMIEVLESEGFRFAPGDVVSSATFTNRISVVDLNVVLQDGKLTFEPGLDPEQAGILRTIAEEADNWKECVTSVTSLIRAFLPVGPELLKVVLLILEKLRVEFRLSISVLCAAMQTAMVRDNGNPSIAVYLDNEMVEIQFSEPFGPACALSVRRNDHEEHVQGIARLFDLLKPVLFNI